MSNLRFIDETKITSSVSSINVEDIFSSDFDIYRITCTDLSLTGTTYVEVGMRLINSAGVVPVTTNYGHGARHMLSWLSYVDAYDNDDTKFRRAFTETTDQSPEVSGSQMWVFNPYSSSHYTYLLTQNTQWYGGSAHSSMHGFGVYKAKEAITGFQAFESDGSRPMAAGTFRTYGLRRDT
tara:strand:- start:2261 stop:2800 length:540 start_codon:yes stop_codon:yes gene_type:complete